MWVHPTILAPANGFSLCALFLSEISADISEKHTRYSEWERQQQRVTQKKSQNLSRLSHTVSFFSTLFRDLNLTSAKFSLFDVLDAEITAALGVDLCFVPWRALVVGAIRVGSSWNGGNRFFYLNWRVNKISKAARTFEQVLYGAYFGKEVVYGAKIWWVGEK